MKTNNIKYNFQLPFLYIKIKGKIYKHFLHSNTKINRTNYNNKAIHK